MKKTALVTGSSGLIGSAVVRHLDAQGFTVHGLDTNARAAYFGAGGDTSRTLESLLAAARRFTHHALDVRDRAGLDRLFREGGPFGLVVHAASQPSHDLSRRMPETDFDVNAVGALNVLEAARRYSPEAGFVLMSTNKVYGDTPNERPLMELPTRLDFALPEHREGFGEDERVDRSTHSIFGASKAAADLLTQEYGRTFGLPTVCLRSSCITGPGHAAVELHGFLSYLVKVQVSGGTYRVHGFGGKQVRDNLHADDVAALVGRLWRRPPLPGTVYNLGGGRERSCSVLEALALCEEITGRAARWELLPQARPGDHACYITDLSRLRRDDPGWVIERSLRDIVTELVETWERAFATT